MYNTQVHWSSKCTPIELVASRQPKGSLPFLARRAKDDPLDAKKFKINLLTHLRAFLLKSKAHTERSAHKYKQYDDRAAKVPPSFRKGDQVYVQHLPNYAHAPEKLQKHVRRSKLPLKSVGSFRVTEMCGNVVKIDQMAYAPLCRSTVSSR